MVLRQKTLLEQRMKGSIEKRFSALPVVVALVVLLALPGVYVCCYFFRSTEVIRTSTIPKLVVRRYPTESEARLYKPLARFEAFVTGNIVAADKYFPLPPQPTQESLEVLTFSEEPEGESVTGGSGREESRGNDQGNNDQ
jgi:hypothetical protein